MKKQFTIFNFCCLLRCVILPYYLLLTILDPYDGNGKLNLFLEKIYIIFHIAFLIMFGNLLFCLLIIMNYY